MQSYCWIYLQVRRRRYFENYQDMLKRKEKQKHMNKRMYVAQLLHTATGETAAGADWVCHM